MFVLPMQFKPNEYSLYVFLQDDNLERIRQYDPASVDISKLGSPWAAGPLSLTEVVIGYATAEELESTIALCKAGRVSEAMRRLTRGFAFRPDRGDTDEPYRSALKP